MLRLCDVLSVEDRDHLRTILGGKTDPTDIGTKRRLRVSQITIDDTYLADDAVAAFQGLSQPDRECLISELVWRLTCHVEGAITQLPGESSVSLECGFTLMQSVREGREAFCVVR